MQNNVHFVGNFIKITEILSIYMVCNITLYLTVLLNWAIFCMDVGSKCLI